MQVSQTQRDSASALMDDFHKFSDAGAALIHIRTREALRAVTVLRKHLIADNQPYKEWDAVNGFRDKFTAENFVDHSVKGGKEDFTLALEAPLEALRSPGSAVHTQADKIHFFVYVDPQPFIKDNPYVRALIQSYATLLPSTNICMVFITPDAPLPDIPVGTVLTTDLSTPSQPELEATLRRIVTSATEQGSETAFPEGHSLEDADFRRISLLGLGLTSNEFETACALSVLEGPRTGARALEADHLVRGVSAGKTEVVRQSEILELMPTADISDVAGMQRLKDWVAARSHCFSDEAKEFGITPPKGAVLVGVPGTGKSLAAKAIASELGTPLVKLDFGRVFSKYVGDSEHRVRAALKMVEQMAPCVLFVDEVDKGLGGAGGGGDSGTSSRVLGSFLTWLQECTAPVFTLTTANRVEGLPPELLRRGRFDQIFSVGMPGAQSRRDALGIHLRKRKHTIDDFDEEELRAFEAATEGYVPAEIESAVGDALVSAFTKREDLSMDHILKAVKDLVPMSVSFADRIAAITEWASANATSVDYAPGDASEAPKPLTTGRRMRLSKVTGGVTEVAAKPRPVPRRSRG